MWWSPIRGRLLPECPGEYSSLGIPRAPARYGDFPALKEACSQGKKGTFSIKGKFQEEAKTC